MVHDVRCTKLHARLVLGPGGDFLLEVKCDSRICRGPATGVVVLHYFSLLDGKLLDTKRYRDPVPQAREKR